MKMFWILFPLTQANTENTIYYKDYILSFKAMYNIVWQQARYFCAINNTRRNCGFIYCYHLVKDLVFFLNFCNYLWVFPLFRRLA